MKASKLRQLAEAIILYREGDYADRSKAFRVIPARMSMDMDWVRKYLTEPRHRIMTKRADALIARDQFERFKRERKRDKLRASYQLDIDEGRIILENGWIIGLVDECTCSPHYGAHEPGCGREPYAQLADLLVASTPEEN